MSWLAIEHDHTPIVHVSVSQHFWTFSDTIWRIADDTIKQLCLPKRRMRQVCHEGVQKVMDGAILLKVTQQTFALAASYAPGIDVTPKRKSVKVCTCYRKASGSNEWIVYYFPGCGECHVRRHQRQLGVHRGTTDITPLLQVVLRNHVSRACSDQATHKQLFGGFCFVFELLKDADSQVSVLHNDWAIKWQVAERLDQLTLYGRRALGLKGVDFEPERDIAIGVQGNVGGVLQLMM